jgi:hypothetical protein
MTTISNQATVVRRDRVVANDLNDSETVMLDIEKGVYFGVQGVGKVIWDRLAEPTTVDDLVDDLVQQYAVDEATCRSDVTKFLGELAGQGLVDVQNPPTIG